MKRVAVIGNSHVAAVKQAMAEFGTSSGLKDFEVTVFGSYRETVRSARVQDGVLRSDQKNVQSNFEWTSGGQTEVEIASFDEIIFIVGLSHLSIEPFTAGSNIPFLSKAMLTEIWAQIKSSWHIQLAKDTAASCKTTRVTHLGIPYPSNISPVAKRILSAAEVSGSDADRRVRLIRDFMTDAGDKFSRDNFRLMGPPEDALEEHGLFTRHEFCKGSMKMTVNMDRPHSSADFRHMNASYGKLLLEKVL